MFLDHFNRFIAFRVDLGSIALMQPETAQVSKTWCCLPWHNSNSNCYHWKSIGSSEISEALKCNRIGKRLRWNLPPPGTRDGQDFLAECFLDSEPGDRSPSNWLRAIEVAAENHNSNFVHQILLQSWVKLRELDQKLPGQDSAAIVGKKADK